MAPALARGAGPVKDQAKWNLSFTPQYAFNNGLRLGIDKKVSRRNWLGVNLEFYNGPVNGDNSANGPRSILSSTGTAHQDAVLGAGICFSDKFFIRSNGDYGGLYLSFGADYTHYNISFQDFDWRPFTKDGLQYISYTFSTGLLMIDKYSAFYGIGYSARFGKVFHADMMFGGGYAKATTRSTWQDGYRSFTRYTYDYQYTGVYPVARVDLGFTF